MENYKEKYEHALDNFKRIKDVNKDNKELVAFIEYEYPELKESEDEEIRNEIIQSIQDNMCVIHKDKCIAWLEKQKTTNKVEPKFKVGDIIRLKGSPKEYTIESISGGSYHGRGWGLCIEADKDYELVGQKPAFCHHEVDLSCCSEEYRKAYYDGWNNCNQQHAQLEAEQKPAWSEEDEEMIECLNNCLDELEEMNGWRFTYVNNKDVEFCEVRNWLEFIKERMKGE